MPAPKGNQNAKRKPWADALKRALARSGGSVESGLNAIADQVVESANNGEWQAIKEISDRVDGKAAQQLAVTGEEGGPVSVTMRWADD